MDFSLMSFIYYTTILIFSTICLIILYYKYKFTYWYRKKIPFVQPSIPFGNVKELFSGKKCIPEITQDIYCQLKSKGYKFGGFYFVNTPVYMPVSPEYIKHILSLDFEYFSERGAYFDEEKDPLQANLFNLPTDRWRKLRVKMTPQFTTGKLRNIFDIIIKCSEYLIEACVPNSNEAIDINDIAVRYTVDVIGCCAFGIDCNSLKNPEENFRKIAERVINPPFWNGLMFLSSLMGPDFLKLGRFRIMEERVKNFFLDIFHQTIEYREKNNLNRNDFMQLLIDMKNKDANANNKDELKMTESLAAAQAFVFFAAGFETSSMTISMCLYELSQNMGLQNKVRQDIVKVLKENNGKLTYDGIMAMVYLDKTIQETLRKYPTLAFLNRVCTKRYKIPGTDVFLEKGTHVLISLFGLQKDPDYFPDPEKFEPERFNDELKSKRNAFTYIPFGEGRRICIGARFGTVQTKVCLANLLANFKFTLNTQTKVPPSFRATSFVLSLKEKIWLNAERLS